MRCPGWNEDGVTYTLSNSPALNTILLVEPLSEVKVQIDQLVMNWISPRYRPKASLLVDLTGIKRMDGSKLQRANSNLTWKNENYNCISSSAKVSGQRTFLKNALNLSASVAG